MNQNEQLEWIVLTSYFKIASSLLGARVPPPHCPIFGHFRDSPATSSIPKHPYMATVGHTHRSLALYHNPLLLSVLQNTDSPSVHGENPLLPDMCSGFANNPHCPLSCISHILVFSLDILLFSLQAEPCFHGHLAPYLDELAVELVEMH